MGKKMAARYDLQEAWRERYKMDEFGVARLQKTVTRAAASLPSVIIWALAPEGGGHGVPSAALAALVLAAAGLRGLVRMRSWGVLALAAPLPCRGGSTMTVTVLRLPRPPTAISAPSPSLMQALRSTRARVAGGGGAAVRGLDSSPLPAPPATLLRSLASALHDWPQAAAAGTPVGDRAQASRDAPVDRIAATASPRVAEPRFNASRGGRR